MSINLFEMKQNREVALKRAEAILETVETGNRRMTTSEAAEYGEHMAEVDSLSRRIKEREAKSTIRHLMKDGMFIPGSSAAAQVATVAGRKFLSPEYNEAFFSYISSSGTRMESALYEGSDGSGGYAVPITVDSNIVPLAPPDQGVRSVASIVPTAMDIKIPRKGSFGVAGAKAESGSTDNSFPEADPTLEQFTLSAFMAGIREIVSWELAQDVPAFQQFAIADMLQAQQIYEGAKYISGSGNGEPQGLLGNVGAGVTGAVADSLGNLLSIDATFDVLGLLKTPYHQNASWLMQRSTAVALRKAQKQANLFEPVFTRVGNQDFLHGYPVVYDSNMPAVAAGATPVLFGDFKQGYVIGDRGGSGINVKILDQVKAIQGQLVLLAYRRSDGRVRRSEAIQAITLHS